MSGLTINQPVKVDGVDGRVASIHPNGSGVYVGERFAYVWVRTPSLDYCDLGGAGIQHVGRAVSFDEIATRIEV